MNKNGFRIAGLMLILILAVCISQAGQQPPSGKYHPKSPARSQTHTVTVLNPALFHRLNTVLEPGLIQGDLK